MSKDRIIALTTISGGWKISISKDVRAILKGDSPPLKIGDKLIYIQNSQGEIVIRRA